MTTSHIEQDANPGEFTARWEAYEAQSRADEIAKAETELAKLKARA